MSQQYIINNIEMELRLYYEDDTSFGIVEDNNMMVEDIGTYVSQFSYDSYIIKAPKDILLDTIIRIPSGSIYTSHPVREVIEDQSGLSLKPYVYACLLDHSATIDETSYQINASNLYFFIRKLTRSANGTTEIHLHLDTLNTFQSKIISNVGSRSQIHRQHCDRFYQPDSIDFTTSLMMKVDPISEGINLEKFNYGYTEFYDGNFDQTGKWFLIYKAGADLSDLTGTNSVDCYLTYEDSLKVSDASSSGTGDDVEVYADDLSSGYYYYLCSEWSDSWSCKIGTTTYSSSRYVLLVYYASDNVVYIYQGTSPTNITSRTQISNVTSINFTKATYFKKLNYLTTDISTLLDVEDYYQINAGTTSVSEVDSLSFSEVDRQDSKLIKIIELPYCPIPMTKDDDDNYSPSSSSGFSFDESTLMWKADSASVEFSNNLGPSLGNEAYQQLGTWHTFSAQPDGTESKSIFDPKCYHSDFFTYKFVYDSFSLSVGLENLTIDSRRYQNPYALGCYLTFKPTNTINSNLLFRLGWEYPNNVTYYADQDFSRALLATRNNEQTIFNNAYINYLKTGYNYDKKTKALTNTSNAIGVVAGVGGGLLAGMMAGGASGSTLGPYGAIAGAVIGGVASIAKAGISAHQQEVSMQSKLTSLQAQATSVSGTDDIDLADEYGGNQLILMYKRVRTDLWNDLDDLFFRFGYKREMTGSPDWDSRYWFNFVSCTPYLDASISNNYEMENEIKNKLEAGVTYYHNHSSTWDLTQEKENWETWLVA